MPACPTSLRLDLNFQYCSSFSQYGAMRLTLLTISWCVQQFLSVLAFPARNWTKDSVLLHCPSACVSQCFRFTIITPVSAQVSIKIPAFCDEEEKKITSLSLCCLLLELVHSRLLLPILGNRGFSCAVSGVGHVVHEVRCSRWQPSSADAMRSISV